MVKRNLSPAQLEKVKRLRLFAQLLDEALPIPGTNYRIGLDGLIGLIPVVGDLITAALALHIITESASLGVPKTILLKMAFNVGVDLLGGAVPLAGDAFDVLWKANKKNLALLEEHLRAEGLLDDKPFIDV